MTDNKIKILHDKLASSKLIGNVTSVAESLYINVSEEEYRNFNNIVKWISKTRGYHHYAFNVPRDKTPIKFRFDIDLSVSDKNNSLYLQKLYTTKQAIQSYECISSIIQSQITDITVDALDSFLLEKDGYISKEKWKNGFHFEFPNLCIPADQHYNLVKKINQEIIDTKIFNSNVFSRDDDFVRNNWLIYGGAKAGCNNPYIVSKLLKTSGVGIYEGNVSDYTRDYITLFWLFPTDLDTPVFSVNAWEKTLGDVTIMKTDPENENEDEDDQDVTVIDTDTVKSLLSSLKESRVEETKSWKTIISSLSNTNKNFYQIAKEWSQTTTKGNYTDESFEYVWNNPLPQAGISYISYFSRMDNKIFHLLINGTNENIAEVLYNIDPDILKVTGQSRAYVYNESKRLWEYKEGTDIFDSIAPYLKKAIKECIRKVYKSDEKREKEQYKALTKTEKMLQTTNFIKNIVNRFGIYFTDNDFENKLNSKHTLLPICNGKVIDLVTGEIRDRVRKDYFSWESIVQDNSVVSSEDIELFYQGLANNDVALATYLKQISLYFLTGLTFDRGFYQLIGVGKNGKSLFINVLRNILRESAINGSRELIIRNSKNPSRNEGPSPHLLSTKGKRLLTFTETEAGDKLNASRIKQLTGGDIIEARQMYNQKIEEFYMSGKILIASNALLEFYDSDQATKDRTRILPFNNRFEQNDNYQKYVTSKEFLTALVLHLVRNVSDCLKNQHIDLPDIIKQENEDLFDNLDIFSHWISECIVTQMGKNTKASVLYNSYLQYSQLNNISDIMSQNSFGRKMKSTGYEKVKKGAVYYENITIREC